MTNEEKELIEKFQSLVDKRDNESCWEWLGQKDNFGQGIFGTGKGIVDAHMLSWLIFYGFLPDGKTVWHSCNSLSCVNPHHLYLEDASPIIPYEPPKLPSNFKEIMPSTYEWMEYWRAHPEQQDEMIKYRKEEEGA